MEALSAAKPIERLVQQKRTGLYLKDDCEWTSDRNAARHFDNLITVFETCYECGLNGVQLILKDIMADFEVQLDLDTR